jgi:hypothetical protein
MKKLITLSIVLMGLTGCTAKITYEGRVQYPEWRGAKGSSLGDPNESRKNELKYSNKFRVSKPIRQEQSWGDKFKASRPKHYEGSKR